MFIQKLSLLTFLLKKSKKKSKTLILLFILYLHLSLHKVDQDVLQYKLLKFKETDEVSFLLYINLFITYNQGFWENLFFLAEMQE